VARGTLRLKGVQQPVEVPFNWVQSDDAAQMDGELIIRRGAFGIGTGEWAATTLVGPDVKVGFSLRLRRDG
jgi:polyisoprenoid-binding protein YceI